MTFPKCYCVLSPKWMCGIKTVCFWDVPSVSGASVNSLAGRWNCILGLNTPWVLALWVRHSLNHTHMLFLMVEPLFWFPSALPSSISINPSIPPFTLPFPYPAFVFDPLLYPSIVASCFIKSDCSHRNIQKKEGAQKRGRKRVRERENGGYRGARTWKNHNLVYLLVAETNFFL